MIPSPTDSGDAGAHLPAPAGDTQAQWVDSFLLTRPGKTYRIEAVGEGAEDATRAAVIEAARMLTDEVVRTAGAGGDPDQGWAPLRP